MKSTVPGFVCGICAFEDLTEVIDFRSVARVTSDCKPWPAGGRLSVCGQCGAVQKIPDAAWHSEISAIYNAFEIYHQSAGVEQQIFNIEGVGAPRSLQLISHLGPTLGLGATGRILDVGCGNGEALANFAAAYPGWELHGCEYSSKTLAKLRAISGFKHLHIGAFTALPKGFDLVMLIHSLEHLDAPVQSLQELRQCLAPHGHIFVQVVDCELTPYDLIIADHLLHFTRETLALTGYQAGFETVSDHSILHKELSWIGRAADTKPETRPMLSSGNAQKRVEAQLHWLTSQARMFQNVVHDHGAVGIFGSAISATWLYGLLDRGVTFFVDEDPARAGRFHMGLPIIPPSEIPAGSHILLPLIPSLASAVANRLAHPDVFYHLPPPLHAAL